jgi:elongation factor Ts
MAISAKDVMALRKRTGLGMMECKEALKETDGDTDAAIAYLQEKLGKKMDDRSDREASEGAIATASNDGSVTMIALKSETDFTAKNDNFRKGATQCAQLALSGDDGDISETTEAMNEIIDELRITIKENISLGSGIKLSGEKVGSYVHHTGKLGVVITGEGDLSEDLLKGLCQHIVVADGEGMWKIPLAIDEAGLPADQLEAAKKAAVDEAVASGKPEQIAEKIAAGKTKKWISDHTLLGQIYAREMDAKKPISAYIPEGAKITGYKKFEL